MHAEFLMHAPGGGAYTSSRVDHTEEQWINLLFTPVSSWIYPFSSTYCMRNSGGSSTTRYDTDYAISFILEVKTIVWVAEFWCCRSGCYASTSYTYTNSYAFAFCWPRAGDAWCGIKNLDSMPLSAVNLPGLPEVEWNGDCGGWGPGTQQK